MAVRTIEDIRKELDEAREGLENFEIDNDAHEDEYRDMLDECFSFKPVGGIFAGMSPARVLEQCDEVAYRCGLNDYIDSLDKADDPAYREIEERIEELESELSDAEDAENDDKPEAQDENGNGRGELA